MDGPEASRLTRSNYVFHASHRMKKNLHRNQIKEILFMCNTLKNILYSTSTVCDFEFHWFHYFKNLEMTGTRKANRKVLSCTYEEWEWGFLCLLGF
jgi:ribosomal protein L31